MMSNREKLEYAEARLSLAKSMSDWNEIAKWEEEVSYWQKIMMKEGGQSSWHPSNSHGQTCG